MTAEVKPTQATEVAIRMMEADRVLDSVKVRGLRSDALNPYREFDERSAHGHGYYITEAMIANAGPQLTSHLFQQINGFYLMGDAVFSSRGVTSQSNSSANPVDRVCKPSLYIDGTPVSPAAMNNIPPAMIHGIEAYASGANSPAKYSTGLCGVILIWTK